MGRGRRRKCLKREETRNGCKPGRKWTVLKVVTKNDWNARKKELNDHAHWSRVLDISCTIVRIFHIRHWGHRTSPTIWPNQPNSGHTQKVRLWSAIVIWWHQLFPIVHFGTNPFTQSSVYSYVVYVYRGVWVSI